MRSLRLFRIGLLLFCCFSVFNGVASAQIPATDDAYTASSSGSGNFGTQPMLNVIGPGVNSYIRFDLTALPPNLTSANVSKATLRLNINGVTMSGAFDVYLVTRSWTEGTLIYNNAPTLGTKVASAIMITTSKRNFIDVDVTPAVQAWFTSPNPAPNYGIALVPSSGSSISVSFDSKENTATSHDPELMVSMVSAGAQGPSGPAGPVGATGPQGATGAQGVMGPQGPPGLQGPPGIDGAPGSPGPVGPPGAGGALNGIQEFNSTGTWTAPGGVTHILVELWGAGGGGGQGGGGFCDETGDCSSGHFGGGGGAGGYTRAVVAVTPGTTYNVIVGDGGTGGSSGTAGTPGAAGADGSASEIQDSSGAVLVSAAGGGGGKGGSGAGLSGLGTSAGGIGGSGANTVGRNGGDATGLGKGGIPASGSIQLSLINIGAGFPPANPGQGGAGGQGSSCDDATLNCFPGAHGFDGLRGYILLTY